MLLFALALAPRDLAIDYYTWISGDRLLVHEAAGFEIIDPSSGARRPAFDLGKANASLQSATKQKTAHVQPGFEVNRAGTALVFHVGQKVVVLNLAAAMAQVVATTDGDPEATHFSPDGRYVSYLKGEDVWAYDLSHKLETRLTTSPAKGVLNGKLSWVYWEELFDRKPTGYWWSPDSKKIALLHSDERQVSTMSFVDFAPQVPRVIVQRFPKAGTANPIVTAEVVDVETGKLAIVGPAQSSYEYLCRLTWSPDSKALAVQSLDRPQTHMTYSLAAADGSWTRQLFVDSDPAWVNLTNDLRFVEGGTKLIVGSERSGYYHLYRYDLKGKLINAISSGSFSLATAKDASHAVEKVAGDSVFATSLRNGSTDRQLYAFALNGKGAQRISVEPGVHQVSFSPTGAYYVVAQSAVGQARELSLHRSDGTLVRVLSPRQDTQRAFTTELTTIPASDGFQMPALIHRPREFVEGRRYPTVVYVYGGPAMPMVLNQDVTDPLVEELTKAGMVVVTFDNRAATGISHKLETLILHRAYGPVELKDLIDGTRWIKRQSWCDADRVGLHGWSGGGTYTLLGMTQSKEFKAGVAGAPVTDWRFYDTKWAEFQMKTPTTNPKGYAETSRVANANHLSGRLLIVFGSYDDNVHPQNEMAFANALIAAGKPYEMVVYPMRKHGFVDEPAQKHVNRTIAEFFRRSL